MLLQQYCDCASHSDASKNWPQAETSAGGGGGGGYCHIWAIWVCAAVKGMVFKQFTLG